MIQGYFKAIVLTTRHKLLKKGKILINRLIRAPTATIDDGKMFGTSTEPKNLRSCMLLLHEQHTHGVKVKVSSNRPQQQRFS